MGTRCQILIALLCTDIAQEQLRPRHLLAIIYVITRMSVRPNNTCSTIGIDSN